MYMIKWHYNGNSSADIHRHLAFCYGHNIIRSECIFLSIQQFKAIAVHTLFYVSDSFRLSKYLVENNIKAC